MARAGAGRRACGRAASSRAPSGERARDGRAAAPAAEGGGDRAQRLHDLGRDPVAQHQRDGELVVELGGAAVVAEVAGEQVERGDLGAGAAHEHLEQADVVDVLVRDDDQLEVLDAAAARGERLLELVERLAGVRPACRRASAGRPRSGSS